MKTKTLDYTATPDPEITPEQTPAENPTPEIPREDPMPLPYPVPEKFPAENPGFPASPEFPNNPVPSEIQRF